MNDKDIIDELLVDVVENLYKTDYDVESTVKRAEEFSNEDGSMGPSEMIQYVNGEARHFSTRLLRETLQILFDKGYLVKPDKEIDHQAK